MAQQNVYILEFQLIEDNNHDDFIKKRKFFTSFEEAEKWIYRNTKAKSLEWNKGNHYWFPEKLNHECNVRKNIIYRVVFISKESLNPDF